MSEGDRDDGRRGPPAYQRIVEHIHDAITTRNLPPGAPLPSERQLSLDFGVARATVVRAMRELEYAGLIERRQGRGTVVATAPEQVRDATAATFVCIFPDFDGPFTTGVMHGIERATRLAGHHLALASSASSAELEAEQLRKAGRMAQGVLLWPIASSPNGPLIAELMAAGCPVVLLDRVLPAPSIDAVVADNVAAGFLLTRYLLEQGHERIAFVRGGELEASSVVDRVAGYEQAFRESGKAPHSGWISAAPYGPTDPDEQRYNCIARLLAQRPPPTAFIAANAAILVTLIRDLVHFGVHIPDDVVVAATDSTAGDSLLRLATASIVFDCAAMGDEAVRLLLKRHRLGSALPAQRVVVPVALYEEQAINVHITPGAAASG